MDIAVIGGGIYGITAGLELSEEGHDVDLFEKEDDIMKAASSINQWRLHRGYHYPRSDETAASCRKNEKVFREYFSEAIITDTEHHYCIASEKTKTTPEEFIEHCERHDLAYERTDLSLVNDDVVDLTVRVNEHRVDPHELKEICRTRLSESDVSLHLDTPVDLDDDRLDEYDYVVVATYANSNTALDGVTELKRDLKFQLVEKPVVELPDRFDGKSTVVMDGPFMCFDPYGRTGQFLLGHVVHAVHSTSVSQSPQYDEIFEPLLNDGVVPDPEVTNIEKFRHSGSNFIPVLAEAEHVGSMFTVRTVLPDVEDTDERPTVLNQSDRVIRIFSGKFVNCVGAAESVVKRVG